MTPLTDEEFKRCMKEIYKSAFGFILEAIVRKYYHVETADRMISKMKEP